jgi:hypothetical protein
VTTGGFMKLSELTYQVVKNVIYLEDAGFSYEAFVNGDYNNDQDYANFINNAMVPINEAIHRLSDRNKIAYKLLSIGEPKDNLIDTSRLNTKIKKIKSIFYLGKNDRFIRVGFREFSAGLIYIETVIRCPLFIQYIEDIKHLSIETGERYNKEKDIDLYNIGITETMCDYIIEYAQGKLLEPIAPELANLHINRAEQYFDDLEEQQTYFTQDVVEKRYGIGR